MRRAACVLGIVAFAVFAVTGAAAPPPPDRAPVKPFSAGPLDPSPPFAAPRGVFPLPDLLRPPALRRGLRPPALGRRMVPRLDSRRPPRDREGAPLRLPNGGRACLVIERCDPRPCILPAQSAPPLIAPGVRCRPGRPPVVPGPLVIPARG